MVTARHELPDGYTLEGHKGSTLTPVEVDTILKILKEGGAVNVASARIEIPHATTLILLKNNEKIVGLGTVKQEREWYAEDVQSAKKSNYLFDPKMLELGYVAIAAGHGDKHLSGHIVDELLKANPRALFATTDHPRMKATLSKRGFVEKGKEWNGERGALSLWLRNAAEDRRRAKAE